MSYPVSGSPYLGGSVPSPAYSGTFIPEIWSGKLLEKFYDATVLAAIANTDYEGEIKGQGDKVKIRTRPTINISDYQAGQSLTVQRPSSGIVELNIDQGKYFNVVLDDVMRVQADINQMDIWAADASEQMKITVDREVLKFIVSSGGISAQNKGATAGRLSQNINLGAVGAPVTISKANVVDYLVLLGQVFDEQNIPETGRWVVAPAWFTSLIKRSDIRNAAIAGNDQSILRNGKLGQIDRFTLYNSNLLPTSNTDGIGNDDGAGTDGDTDGATHILAGHSMGLTFASQLTNVETLRAESTFGQLMRGLQVYGRQIIQPTALADLYAVPASGAGNPSA